MRVMRGTACVAVLCLAAVAAAGARTNATPTIRFTDLSPVQVKGTQFLPGVTVRVVLHAGASKRVRTIRVSTGGTFTVGFGTLSQQEKCNGTLSLAAMPARGTGTVYRLPTPACIDPHGPPTTSAPGPATRKTD
jgi:hypothetical protein